jgi:hypothetical protein
MSLLKQLLGHRAEPAKRVRVCVECGMPLPEHKEWCAILRRQREIDERRLAALNARAVS